MTITNKAYTDADLPRLREFVITAAGLEPAPHYMHPGDLVWWLFQNTVFDPYQKLRLWEQNGELIGHAWIEKLDGIFMQVHPRLRGTGQIEDEMLAWALTHADEIKAHGDGSLWVSLFDGDTAYRQLFEQRGFVRDSARLVAMRQPLHVPPAPETLSDGFIVRHVGGEDEWNERVETHREVWHPSRVTLEAYQRLRNAPGYIPELDLVVVAPDGTFAAYCICWLDPVNKRGLFEPVGTRPAFRGQRLGRAVMLEGLRRLHAHGARAAQVLSLHDNVASLRLYESVGFEIVDREWLYGRRLP